LHFSAEKNDQFFDPQTLNLDGMRTLGGAERGLFAQVKQNYDRLLDAVALPEPLPAEHRPSPAASVVLDPSAEEPEGPEVALPPGPAPAPAPPRPGAAPAPATQPAAARGSGAANPIYLTDDELLKMQGTSDDGEVEQ
jgi:hypothetical protein